MSMPLDIRVDASLENGILTGEIAADAPAGARYAFHVLRNDERIHVRWYSPDRRMQLPVDDQPGIYKVVGFMRVGREKPVRQHAPRILRSGPPLGLKDIAAARGGIEGPLTVKAKRFEWPCLFFPKADSRLFVLLSARVDRKTHKIPVFNRHLWKGRFPGSVLCVADPTLALSDSLGLGWYLGDEKRDATTELAQLVRAFARSLDMATKSIVCYGSSGGGFAALSLAARLKGATAVAINPQTNVIAYQQRAMVEEMVGTCFPGRTPAGALRLYPKRLSMLHAYAEKRLTSRVIYVQNRIDAHHYSDHFLPFALKTGLNAEGGCSADGRHYAFVYDHENGHGPEPEALFPDIIAKAVEFNGGVSA